MRSVRLTILASFWKVLGFPIARIHWATARDGRTEEDWGKVINHVEAMHKWHWKDSESSFLLGCAYAHVDRYEDAVIELQRVGKPLNKYICEQERRLNLAVCLDRLDRSREALELIPEDQIDELFPDYRVPAADVRRLIAARMSARDDSDSSGDEKPDDQSPRRE